MVWIPLNWASLRLCRSLPLLSFYSGFLNRYGRRDRGRHRGEKGADTGGETGVIPSHLHCEMLHRWRIANVAAWCGRSYWSRLTGDTKTGNSETVCKHIFLCYSVPVGNKDVQTLIHGLRNILWQGGCAMMNLNELFEHFDAFLALLKLGYW